MIAHLGYLGCKQSYGFVYLNVIEKSFCSGSVQHLDICVRCGEGPLARQDSKMAPEPDIVLKTTGWDIFDLDPAKSNVSSWRLSNVFQCLVCMCAKDSSWIDSTCTR